jgi:SNF2 family DNA or RNA helicase
MIDLPFVHQPLAHQLEELEISHDLMSRALYWEMGTGKSKVIIDTAAYRYLKGELDVVVIIAKKGEYSNWKYVELPEHMPKEVPYDCAVYRSGMREPEKQAIRNLIKPSDKLHIICVNVESMTSDGGKCARALVKTKKKGAMIVVDESPCVKNHKSERSKAVYDLAKYCDYRRILSGTPITRSPLDLWGQAMVLGPGILGHSNFFSFKADYVVTEKRYYGTRVFNEVVGYQRLDRLTKQLKTYASIKERKECLDLPDKIYKKFAVEMTAIQEDLYNQMKQTASVEFGDDQIIDAVNALGVISRCDQIACGQLKREDGTFEILDNNRIPLILEDLAVDDKKGIIWCNYKGLLEHLYKRICEEYGPELVGRYYGGVPDEEREATVKGFQDPGHKLRWIVANQQSLGYGRTLTTGKKNWYASNGYNLEHRLQSEDRTMRLGQHDTVWYGDFYCPDTVNERVLQLLRTKRNLASEVLGTSIREWI